MKKGLRLSEQWFARCLWLIALLFAGFLIGLGGKIVGDLPKAETSYVLESFIDHKAMSAIEQQQAVLNVQRDNFIKEINVLEDARRASEEVTDTAEQNFNAWVATRSASQASAQNPELVKRTQRLEDLRDEVQKTKNAVRAKEKELAPLLTKIRQLEQQENLLKNEAATQLNSALQAQDLRVFLYRLALTLPLLGIAAWLFVKQRKTVYWPFVWGFIFFALFAFFVELVPYLPSYGGYVRYAVGVGMTAVIGNYAIKALQRYQTKQAQVEQMPEAARREELDYEQALQRMAKNICPGCERPIQTAVDTENYCGHCGMGLFRPCGGCGTRHNAFSKFCKVCGLNNPAVASNPP